MAAFALADYDDSTMHDNIVRLHGVPWADYERLLDLRGEHAVPRYTYFEGELEIMSPSRPHESIKSCIGRLVEVWCLERGVEFSTVGSWTIKNEATKSGLEPDESYVFGNPAHASVPHLAIEVVWTSGGLDKLQAYERLGVSEVWFWARGRIQIHVLEPGGYVTVEQSRVLPGVNLRELERYIEAPTTSQAIREYRAALR